VLPWLARAAALLRRLGQHDCDLVVLSHRKEPQIELVKLVLTEPASQVGLSAGSAIQPQS
jgi:hypothetical protein